MTDGSAGSSCSESGSGSSQGTSARSTSSSAGLELGAPRPVGSGLRPRPSSAVRQVLVAIRCSQVRTDDLPSNRS